MLSPCFLVLLMCLSITTSSVIYGSLFTVDALLSLPTCCRPLFLWPQVSLCLLLLLSITCMVWTFYFTLAIIAIPLDCVFLIHCIIITHISPSLVASLLVAVVSTVLPCHDLITLLLTYPLLWCLEACYGSLRNKINKMYPPSQVCTKTLDKL